MNVSFLLAEEVRLETQNKVTVLGLYPGDVIVIVKGGRTETVSEETPAALERVTILAIVRDAPDGLHKFKGRIVEPSGVEYKPMAEFGEATTKQGFSHTVIIEMKPLLVKQPGHFNFEFFVDDQMFTFPFEIREQA